MESWAAIGLHGERSNQKPSSNFSHNYSYAGRVCCWRCKRKQCHSTDTLEDIREKQAEINKIFGVRCDKGVSSRWYEMRAPHCLAVLKTDSLTFELGWLEAIFNKHPMGCEAQLAGKWLFTPNLSAGDFDP